MPIGTLGEPIPYPCVFIAKKENRNASAGDGYEKE